MSLRTPRIPPCLTGRLEISGAGRRAGRGGVCCTSIPSPKNERTKMRRVVADLQFGIYNSPYQAPHSSLFPYLSPCSVSLLLNPSPAALSGLKSWCQRLLYQPEKGDRPYRHWRTCHIIVQCTWGREQLDSRHSLTNISSNAHGRLDQQIQADREWSM